ncbi:uncharacterized protein LOC108679832 [Hyalella azteca]|uniref:Uncharacterized protein LOC108679832 n=1 Tax=Hyalella azteca TaxID=294128 RepID=A0A8B7PD76_HYAAZ|nr:uncharacterized protein LOC108679832 [Hyalella azteca]
MLSAVFLVCASLVVAVQGRFIVVPMEVESCGDLVPAPVPNKDSVTAALDRCMARPRVAAIISSYQGPEEDRTAEILLTCFADEAHLIISTGLMADYFMESVRLGVQGTRMESSVVAALSVCDAGLLQRNMIVPFMRCVQNRCEEK